MHTFLNIFMKKKRLWNHIFGVTNDDEVIYVPSKKFVRIFSIMYEVILKREKKRNVRK